MSLSATSHNLQDRKGDTSVFSTLHRRPLPSVFQAHTLSHLVRELKKDLTRLPPSPHPTECHCQRRSGFISNIQTNFATSSLNMRKRGFVFRQGESFAYWTLHGSSSLQKWSLGQSTCFRMEVQEVSEAHRILQWEFMCDAYSHDRLTSHSSIRHIPEIFIINWRANRSQL